MPTLEEIRSRIDRADSAYHRPGLQPIMTDAEYDSLKTQLKQLYPTDERLTRVGVPYAAEDLRNKVEHTIPMGSLDNTDDGIIGFDPWYESITAKLGATEPPLVASVKVDGASIRARYENGVLAMVATRGNGEVGENITANGVNFAHLPTVLPEPITCDVRGEAILFVADFQKICERDFGRPFAEIPVVDLSNPRNVGNGILGRDDGADSQYIQFLAFNIVSDREYTSYSEKLQHLTDLGFQPVLRKACNSAVEVRKFYDTVANGRNNLPFEIDGVVVTLDKTEHQQPFITKDIKSQLRPKFARAIKFPHKSGITVLEGVLLTVGHTRAIIPTAKLREVRVGGVNVTHALLNNWTEIERLGVAVGDEVEVVLAGDIIPKIIRCVKPSPTRTPIQEPKRCPSCGNPTTRTLRGEVGAVTYCCNKSCPAAALAKIDHWIGNSKKGVGILGIGDTILKAMWDNQVINDPADLYTLTADDLAELTLDGGGRIGKSRAEKIIKNIDGKRKLKLHTFLGSLGIELLGRRRVQLLVESAAGKLDTLEQWLDTAELAKMTMPGLGDTIKLAICAGIDENRTLIQKLLQNGVTVEVKTVATAEEVEVEANGEKPFAGLSFCLTGTRECIDDIERLGGGIKSGVSKGLSFLVQKDPLSASNKTQKADELGVKVISLDCLKDAISGMVDLRELCKVDA